VAELEKDNAFLVKSLGVLCRDAEEPARFALMAKYAGPDDLADTAGIVPLRNERRFSVRRMARLLGCSAPTTTRSRCQWLLELCKPLSTVRGEPLVIRSSPNTAKACATAR